MFSIGVNLVFLLVASAFTLACVTSAFSGVTPTETYERSLALDKDETYLLFWKANETHITFEAHVRTKGWVGLGISDNGKMFPADVVVGWVNTNGSVYFSDRHTTGHSMPEKDKVQDWQLLEAQESEFGTVLKVVRLRISCDQEEDKDIKEGATRLIYAYGSEDPVDEDSIAYHGTTRGTKSVYLLDDTTKPVAPQHVKHFDMLNDNLMVPNKSTTYYCRGFTLPDIGRHHMIKYEPIITPGNENILHHVLIYGCSGLDNPEQYDGVSEVCYETRNPKLPQCTEIVVAWAIGGQAFYFPDHVGFPIDRTEYDLFVMETHYDNPTRRSDIMDNSGLRITLTPEFRQYEAGMWMLGHDVTDRQLIPPGDVFVSKGYCHADCLLLQGFEASNLTEVRIIGALQHSHLLGVAIKTRHFRNGTELKPLMQDPNYDFDFQEFRKLPEEVAVYPGDSFLVECTYDSTDRTQPTFGGLSTQEEMCLTLPYYYPKMAMTTCTSWSTYDQLPMLQDFEAGVRQLDWTNATVVSTFKEGVDKSSVDQLCYGKLTTRDDYHLMKFVPEEPDVTYTPPPATCT